ncbi:RHS repeat-associated core domain-containing protein [Asanoa siamensis]|uniref:RHS repeat-associated core domain-containing protein n=1 Tax=Asanoa siamensis TaxID=926357 RepID=UPI001EF38EAC|nr:RHS repeat-associated core domain-containing protein [Asanoa siamensis]
MFDVQKPPAGSVRGGNGRRRLRALVAVSVVGALVGGVLAVTPAQAQPDPASGGPTRSAGPAPQLEKPDADGGPVRHRAWPHTPQRRVAVPPPSWPAAGTARVSLPGTAQRQPVRAGGLPVHLDRAAGAAGERLSAVGVRVLDRATAPQGWRDGVLLRVGAPASAATGTAELSVDYGAFRHAYGGDWASRLRLWQLPECAVTTPAAPGCAARPLPSRNDGNAGTVTADVPVGAGDAAADTAAGTLIALAAGPSGAGGDFTATALSPSATWSAGGNGGGFTWSYPMQAPPAIAGPEPELALAYSSSSVDGRSEVTNNQPSWVGEGFDYWPGYIERRYVPCAEDMGGGANNTRKTGDLCWRSDNAVLSLGGQGTELVYEAGKGWHGRQENGSRVEKLTGAGNGDDNGEYWKVTSTDGTQYFFGLDKPSGQSTATNSTWTVPVAGNHPAAGTRPEDPCHATTFTSSFCAQAWRWNLDHVVDVRGNTISYWYAKEANRYARNLTDGDAVSYTRGGTLTRIDYGTWDRGATDRSVQPTAQVLFDAADRCVTSSCGSHNAANWPDTPWDQECTGSSCPNKYSPTFWSTKRLAKITTRVWDTTKPTAAWQDVDSWTLTHSFPPLGDGSDHAGLWLEKIVHAGLVGTAITMPPVTFAPVSMPNRVLTMNTTTSNWQRIDYIVTETGAKIDVTYDRTECTESRLPASPQDNGMRCYPVMVTDPDDPQGERVVEQWWHKHRVTAVSQSDLPSDHTGHPAPPVFTYYTYVGAPAWHYADDDGLTKPKRKTWNQFRGYATVEVRTGDVPGAQTLTRTRYLRGMHGDRANAAGTSTRSVTAPASIGTETVYDEDQFAGMVREEVVYNGVDTKPVSRTVNVPWMSPATASRTINGDTVTARFTNTRATYRSTALGVDGARGWRTTRTQSWFDDTYGTVERNQDDGNFAAGGDETCTTFSYNRNTGKNLTDAVRQTTTTALPCGAAPTRADQMISDSRNYFDGATSVATAPTYGSVTMIERLDDWSPTGGTVWRINDKATFDAFGRVSSTTDAKGGTTRIGYTPASGGPVTRMTTTTPAPFSWVTTADVNPYWGSTTKKTNQNGGVTDVAYDGMGRVWRVWNVGWPRAGHESMPSEEYTYSFAPDRDAYPYTTSRTLHAGGGYRTTYQISDSLLRSRQTQAAGIGGERVVTDINYDKLGRAASSYAAHVEPGNPSGTLWWEPEWSVPAVTRTVFDNASRPVAEIFLSGDGTDNLVEQWRTTTAYEGDLTKVTPPEGGTATTTVVDVRGRTTELRQHTTDQGVGGAYQSTSYTYDGRGDLTLVADPAGNRWTYAYDVKGRPYASTDPDKGRTSTEFNQYDEVQKTTDARGESLWFGYDTLGRKTELRDDSSTGRLRAKWKYDTLYTGSTAGAKGQLTETYRYEYDSTGAASIYKWQVGGFNSRSQPSNVNYVIPAVEGADLATTWSFGYGYSAFDGSPTSVLYPGGGGLTNETVTTTYDATTGLPTRLGTTAVGVNAYVSAQDYTRFGEPTRTVRKTANGRYVEDTTFYDEATRRIRRTTVKPEGAPGTVSDRGYDYFDSGAIRAIADTPQVGNGDNQCFRYDALRRLTSAWTPKAGVACGTAPSVANLGGPAPYWLDWAFDAVGNRTKEVSRAAAGDTTRTYTLPAGGPDAVRPHAVTRVTTSAPGQPDLVTNYGYDNSGNTTCRPTGTAANACPTGTTSQTLSWDAESRVAGITASGSTVESNVYAADGARLVRRDSGGVTLYLPGQELRRDKSGTVTGTRYYTFAGKLVASRTASGLTWVYSDHQGTQHTSVDELGQAVTVRRQTPYGQNRGGDPAWANAKGFVGGDRDATGMTQLGARKYDPALGRFISVDPVQDLADPQQWHGYSYANNDPVTRSDPTGLAPCEPGEDCSGYKPGNEQANRDEKEKNPCWPTTCGSTGGSSGGGNGGGGNGGGGNGGGKGGDGWRGVPWAYKPVKPKFTLVTVFPPARPWRTTPYTRPCPTGNNSAWASPAECEEAHAAAAEEYAAKTKQYERDKWTREEMCWFPLSAACQVRPTKPEYPSPKEALERKRAADQPKLKGTWSMNGSGGLFCFIGCGGIQIERGGIALQVGCCGIGGKINKRPSLDPGAGLGVQYAEGKPGPWSLQGCGGIVGNVCGQTGPTEEGGGFLNVTLNSGTILFFGPMYTHPIVELPQ